MDFMIDRDGFRPNVGIILLHPKAPASVLWAKRVGQAAWQFPQGGIKRHEAPEAACLRELEEELGLKPEHVEVLGVTDDWLRYLLPANMVRSGRKPACIGQKQKWFLLRLLANESAIRLNQGERPEFERWVWVDYWHPLKEVVYFKREVYLSALQQLAPIAGAAPAA
jgi:putative (di)nucleoside polyphosphate hydrolase